MNFKPGIALLLIFLWMPNILGLMAQDRSSIHAQWRMNHLTVDDGLSNNFVHDICQDQRGYIWIATAYGLNRYNGMQVKKYFQQSTDSLSLSDNYVWSVFLDTKHSLWVGSKTGLQRYNDDLDHFENFSLPDSVEEREVFDITEDHEGNVLFASSQGLYSYNRNENITRRIELEQMGMRSDSIYRVLVDDQNNLWIARFMKGLFYFDRQQQKITSFFHDPEDVSTLSEDWIFRLFIDSRNTLWVGTYNSGLCKLNPSDSSFTRYLVNPDDLFSYRVRSLFEDKWGRVFAGTRNGLYLYNQGEDNFSCYATEDHLVSQLSQNSVTTSFIDEAGIVWMGTHSGGVTYFDMFQKPFVTVPAVPDNPLFLNEGSVHCFVERASELLIGTDHGLNILDRKTGLFTYVTHDPDDPNSLSYNDIKSIAVASPDSTWIATNRGGLELLDKNNRVIKHLRHQPGNDNTIPSDNLYGVCVDNQDKVWFLSNKDWDRLNSELSYYDPHTDSIKTYPGSFFLGLTQTADGSFLVGGSYGFYEYNQQTDRFIAHENDSLIYRTNIVFKDRNDKIWLGHNRGLASFDPETQRFTNESERFKLPLQEVYGILADGDDFWISSNNGLFHIKNMLNDQPIQYHVYLQADGLQSREFNYNAFHMDNKRNFYFGGDKGYNVFDPQSIKKNPFPPEIEFASFKLNGEEVHPRDTIQQRVLLSKMLNQTKNIVFDYDAGYYSFTFDALHYANARNNRYKYQLQPLETTWTYSNAYNNEVAFHNLTPGDYRLVVYAINSDGTESMKPAEIEITVLSPFWQTPWFRLLIAGIIIGLTILYFQMRMRFLKRNRALLVREVKERTQELELERKHLENTMNKLVESEKLASLGTLTAGIAHEIKNPLNFISGSMNSLYEIIRKKEKAYPDHFDNNEKELVIKFETFIKEGISRINRIVGSLQNFSRKDSERFKKYNLVQCIEDAVIITESKTKNRISIVRSMPENVMIECLPGQLSQVFINLIDNAADAIVDQGQVELRIKQNASHVRIEVEDSGNGIPQEVIKSIFDPFYTTKEVGKGTGLGLYISHSIITMHQGQMHVQSEPGKGAEFIIELPMIQKT